MKLRCKVMGKGRAVVLAAVVWLCSSSVAFADGATRSMPTYFEPDVLLTVSIEVVAPAGTMVVGVEDVPPAGWINITNISDGGIYDSANHKVKWPPFFNTLSRTVSFDITPPTDAAGLVCFAGVVSFDGTDESIAGDPCVLELPGIPTVSELGLITMAVGLLVVGAFIHRKRKGSQTVGRCS